MRVRERMTHSGHSTAGRSAPQDGRASGVCNQTVRGAYAGLLGAGWEWLRRVAANALSAGLSFYGLARQIFLHLVARVPGRADRGAEVVTPSRPTAARRPALQPGGTDAAPDRAHPTTASGSTSTGAFAAANFSRAHAARGSLYGRTRLAAPRELRGRYDQPYRRLVAALVLQ